MNRCLSQWEQVAELPGWQENLAFALDEALVSFCDAAFSTSDSTGVREALVAQGYGEPDLVAAHSLCIYLLLHREQVTTGFRAALASHGPGAVLELEGCAGDTAVGRDRALRVAACGLLKHLAQSGCSDAAVVADHVAPPVQDAGDVGAALLFCTAVLDDLGALFPMQSEVVDMPTCGLLVLCLHGALVTELSLPDELPALD